MRATASATVPASISQVWAALADHEGMAAWGPGMTVTLTREGTTERNGLGAVRRIKAPGPAPAIVEEITGFEPDRLLAYKAVSGVPFKNYRGEVALTAAGAGTRIEWTLSADRRLPLVEGLALKGVVTALLRLLVKATRS